MRRHSLKARLLAFVFVLVIGSGMLIALLATQRYSASLRQSMSAQAENFAHAVALEATDRILINDLVGLQKTLDHHKRSNPAIGYLFIYRDGRVLAHTFSHGLPAELIGANGPAAGHQAHFQKITSTGGDRYLDIAWPIFGGKAGLLRLGLSEKPYQRQMTVLWLQMIGLTLAILLIAAAVGLVFIKRITQPLSLLARAAEKINADNLEVSVALGGHDEVGKLAASFNHMVGRIKDYTRRLEEKTLALDRAHRQTTTSFTIAREIGALSNLTEVCSYLIDKLREIIRCRQMGIFIFGSGRDVFFTQSEGVFGTLRDWPVARLEGFFSQSGGLQFLDQAGLDALPLPEQFKSAQQLAAFPIRHENQLMGALLIACPGECQCVAKELDVVDLVLNQTTGAIWRAALQEEEIRELRSRIEHQAEFSGLVGKDPRMQVIYKLIEDIAATDATVLIQGESGTGKELVAQAIHHRSRRKDSPFVVINCSAYPATLLESELFGHEQGAFTGAGRRKSGRFEQADGGTVFLDEIGEVPPAAQIRLLRVLQSQRFERVGGEQTLTVNVRILAATNKDLLREVKKGHFREDLFYRLNVIPVQLPPLRKRRNDIPLLARHFLGRFAAEQGKDLQEFSSEAMRRLLDYAWPGNVRELENSIEHASVLARGPRIHVADLPAVLVKAGQRQMTGSAGTMLENEKKLLLEVLEECGWNKKQAALRLGISRSTLYDKLKKYQLARPTVH